jgi:Spy/CpxP family protein refolding chaperone
MATAGVAVTARRVNDPSPIGPTALEGRPLPTADVGYPVAQVEGQLYGGEIARPTGAGRPGAVFWSGRLGAAGNRESDRTFTVSWAPRCACMVNPENAVRAKTWLLVLAFSMPLPTLAQHSHGTPTPYAGMQSRAIKSLSDSDIQELRRGGGWGLALAAELNGMPGPAHLLELKDRIPLTADQVAKTQALFDDMRKAAIPTGERLIAAEQALETAFAKGAVDEAVLRRLLADAESARTELRFIHLSQHFKTVQYLKPEQIKKYAILRGYADDLCKNIPAGHNPEMYRRHMGCN